MHYFYNSIPSLAYILLLAMLLTACTKSPELTKIEGHAQGTTYHLAFDLPNKNDLATIEQSVIAELQRLDTSISNYRKDSTIELFNAEINTDPHEVNEEIVKLVEYARNVSKASNGCYDLTIKPLFDLWGFKKNVFTPPSDEALLQTLQLVGMDNLITVDATHLQKQLPNIRVDLSSIGQGYSVGRIADILERYGVENYMVEIGGELKTRGKKPDGSPWRIAIENPVTIDNAANKSKVKNSARDNRTATKIAVFNSGEAMSLMPSGTYHHYFDNNGKRYSHILDGRTGKPVEHNSVSVSVFIANPTLADAWSTALLCLGSEAGIRVANENNIAALFIDKITDKDDSEFIEKKTRALSELRGIALEEVNN